jgi:hypothetical protein
MGFLIPHSTEKSGYWVDGGGGWGGYRKSLWNFIRAIKIPSQNEFCWGDFTADITPNTALFMLSARETFSFKKLFTCEKLGNHFKSGFC